MAFSSKLVLGALAVALILAGSVLLGRPSPPPAAAPIVVQSDARARAELSALRRDLALTQAQLVGLAQEHASPPALATVATEPVRAELPPAVKPEAAQAHFQGIIEHEALDASWARAEERSISDFVSEQQDSSLTSVTCRSTLCRLEVSFKNNTSLKSFQMKLGLPPLDKGGFFHEEAGNKLVFYSAREGHPLPDVPADE